MLRKNRGKLLLSSLGVLLPLFAGLLLWNRLPEQIALHWGADGMPNGWGSRTLAVFGLPLMLLGIHWLCILLACADPKRRNIQGKPLHLVLLICPVTSLFCGALTYASALGISVDVLLVTDLFLGLLLILVGSYLPKCRQNYFIGIRIPWTLHDGENWDKTHRFAGPVWMVAGGLTLLLSPLHLPMLSMALVLLAALVPVAYSFFLYWKKGRPQS